MTVSRKWSAPHSEFLVPFDASFRIGEAPTAPSGKVDKDEVVAERREHTAEIGQLQRRLYADDRYAVLFVFQAMDAGGKDSTIRNVFTGVNPAGFQVSSFKAPSDEELDHDFLWRISERLPERGRIGVFNRSHYEEVLIVRVHPEFLEGQRLPDLDLEAIWPQRYESIRNFEKHIAENGTIIVKFFLNVSLEEQKKRLLRRIEKSSRNWKFNPDDVKEREHWPDYMHAFEDALNETSRPWAPWYAIPADDKPYMRLQVARIVRETLANLGVDFPKIDEAARLALAECRKTLERS
ncbi:MAG: polyphosphate kinase 2 family protein [Deltaproteobacteria bacterium]|nr:polyphosphate kinase 2 family protein [Deltaproteobacteria bacterium]NND27906.1 polyphosphate kinase 2 family protein [Myxococcales bacterium]MBT8465362.1 polyphosphate kinase 2 family protein [Deltaproteobacteria bacterium]MBT8481754.1 polyphosphate kinase 2 family protein [Deltaproteobacteria bacterium]NNK08348.1 polyphosphate kinase 2 family protein [Myxococcales bacterium]